MNFKKWFLFERIRRITEGGGEKSTFTYTTTVSKMNMHKIADRWHFNQISGYFTPVLLIQSYALLTSYSLLIALSGTP